MVRIAPSCQTIYGKIIVRGPPQRGSSLRAVPPNVVTFVGDCAGSSAIVFFPTLYSPEEPRGFNGRLPCCRDFAEPSMLFEREIGADDLNGGLEESKQIAAALHERSVEDFHDEGSNF